MPEHRVREEDEKNRRFYALGVIFFAVTILLVVVVIVVLTLNKSPRNSKNVATVGYDVSIAPSQPPSASPTTTSTFAELLSTLESLYESCDGAENFATVFANESSPQHLAASWAADSASIVGINGDDVRMINRFALATLYFATNGDEWYMCGRGSTFCDASQEWLTGENECDWHAIGCEDDDFHITDIFFRKFSTNHSRQ